MILEKHLFPASQDLTQDKQNLSTKDFATVTVAISEVVKDSLPDSKDLCQGRVLLCEGIGIPSKE